MGLHQRFKSWDALLSFIERGGRVFYHAPLDVYPVEVQIAKVYKNKKIRVVPPSLNADAFTADEGHLDRFRWCVPHQYREASK